MVPNPSRTAIVVLAAVALLGAPAIGRVASSPPPVPLTVVQPGLLNDDFYQIGILDGMSASAVSPDGQHLYVASWYDNTITTFRRDTGTGALTLVQVLDYYITETGFLFGATGVAVSPDGAQVYVTSGDSAAVVDVFSRNVLTGELTLVDDVRCNECSDFRPVFLSPDGANLYTLAEYPVEVSAWSRNTLTGSVTFMATYTDAAIGGLTSSGDGLQTVAISPDGAHLYVGRAIFGRDGSGTLTSLPPRTGIEGRGVTISADGQFVYATGDPYPSGPGRVEVFSRNAGTGALTSIQMIDDDTGPVVGLSGAESVVISPDGAQVYVAGRRDKALTVFSRNAGTGLLTFVQTLQEGVNGVYGLHETSHLTFSPDGAYLYVSGYTQPSSIAVFKRNAGTGTLSSTAVVRGTRSGCTPTPWSGCMEPILPGKASLVVQDKADDAKDTVVFKWTGEATSFFDFDFPTVDHFGDEGDHAVCVYDDTGLVLAAVAPAGQTCRNRPCWKTVGASFGYDYSDALRSEDGITKIQLRSGGDGAARVSAKLGGLHLATPAPPFSGTVRAQLHNDYSCWDATYSAPSMNQPGLYKAKSD